jgi:hypothetical protein
VTEVDPVRLPPPRGWYADPFERLRYRFWDGQQWSGYAADDEVVWDDVQQPSVSVDTDVAPVKRGLLTAFLGYFIGLALGVLADRVMNALDYPGGRTVALVVTQACLWSGLIGACLVVSVRRGTGSLVRDFDWRFRKIDIGLGLAGALVGRVIAILVILPLPIAFGEERAPEQDVFDQSAEGALGFVVLLVIVCIGAPLVEELFFRGLMQPRLVQLFGATRGLLVTAVLFGMAHLTNWQGRITIVYVTSIAGAGLILGLIRHVSGRLGPSTTAHFWFNVQAMALLALARYA